MRMVEYDLDSSSISAGLHLAARTEVEQRCTIYIYLYIYLSISIYLTCRCQPTCCLWHPPSLGQEAFLVIANKVQISRPPFEIFLYATKYFPVQHGKQRLVNMSTKMCRRVVAGPHSTNKHISKSALNIFLIS